MSKKNNRLHGHYCKICGEYKANEKFSGKGHATHICKACSRLSAAEKAAAMDMNRLMSFPMRRLSESEKKWLKAKMKDNCPEVADTAKEVYNVCFPHAERNAMKKQFIINTLSFKVHTEVYDRYGDMEMADCLFTIDRKSRTLTMTDFHADSGEQSVVLDGGKMAKLLRYIVHTLEIFMWEQDYCLNPDGDDFLRIFFFTCQNVQKNCIFLSWSILNQIMKSFDLFLFYARKWYLLQERFGLEGMLLLPIFYGTLSAEL